MRRSVNRPTSSKIAAKSRSEVNSATTSARMRVVGGTRGATVVGPPSALRALEGTYARWSPTPEMRRDPRVPGPSPLR
jgi:hypothetical protein